MDLSLRDKVATVTGASGGIGAAVAVMLARESADVMLTYGRNTSGAEQTASAVRDAGRRAWRIQMDVENPASAGAAVDRMREDVAHPDILILNAGCG